VSAVFPVEVSGIGGRWSICGPTAFEDIIRRWWRCIDRVDGEHSDLLRPQAWRRKSRNICTDARADPEGDFWRHHLQEQVMQIAQVMAGYRSAKADLMRRAMGKKIRSEMEKQRAGFVAGAMKTTYRKPRRIRSLNYSRSCRLRLHKPCRGLRAGGRITPPT